MKRFAERFGGRPILISGAGRGLGEGIAKQLAAEGAVVGVADVNGQTARDVAQAPIVRDLGLAARVPPGRIHRMEADAPDLDAAARGYERALREAFGVAAAVAFDVVTLGVGDDGHTHHVEKEDE